MKKLNTEAVSRRYSVKKVFLKISQNSQERTSKQVWTSIPNANAAQASYIVGKYLRSTPALPIPKKEWFWDNFFHFQIL